MKNRYFLFVNHIYTLLCQNICSQLCLNAHTLCTMVWRQYLAICMIQPHQAISSVVWEKSVAGIMNTDVGRSVSSLPKGPPRKRTFSSLCCSCGIYQVNQVQQPCMSAALWCGFQLLCSLYMAIQEKLPSSNRCVTGGGRFIIVWDHVFNVWLLIKDSLKECSSTIVLCTAIWWDLSLSFDTEHLNPSAFFEWFGNGLVKSIMKLQQSFSWVVGSW